MPTRTLGRRGAVGLVAFGALVGLALVGRSVVSAAQDYSMACPSTNASKLADDTYKGEFEARVTATGKLISRIELREWGTFTMVRESGGIKSLTGKVYFSMNTFTSHFLNPSATMNAEGTLESGGPSADDDRFDLGGELTGAASFGTSDRSYSGGGSTKDVLSFTVTGAGCDSADGKLSSVALSAARARLLGLGQYEVTDVSSYWSANTETREGEASKKLKEDLDRVMGGESPSPSLVRTRGTMANSAAKIANDLVHKYEHWPLIECLLQKYRDYVARHFKAWVQDDTTALQQLRTTLGASNKAQGSGIDPGAGNQQFQKLEELLRRAIEADRSLALFGVDSCYVDVHEALWTEVNASLDAMLTWRVKSGATPQDLLRTLRQAELLGEISPPLRERVYAAIARASERLFAEVHTQFAALRAASPASCSSGVQAGYRLVQAAAKQCQLVQGACTFPTDADFAWQIECRAGSAQ